ncbi:uncharacterized protein LOC126700448 [Quercus robur]|uniref:uncharacterized protein LOC126700448 n=1 Tax=Quercus robur TaxID=38942 RepID=UPI0021633E3D|nr:uncharacterized protein LOC126700448 [Quercus robur]
MEGRRGSHGRVPRREAQSHKAAAWSRFLQRVFSIDTIVKPLPPAMAYNVSRNLNFFTRIFTQFFDPEGIANAQKSLGIGQEEKARRVR